MKFPAIPEDDAFVWPKAKPDESIQDRIYRQITYLLSCGFFRPGEKISLRQLSAGLDVSETPIRTAVSRLVAESALDVLPNRHVSIPALTLEQFQELTTLRTQLEGSIAEHSCKNIDSRHIRELSKLNDALLGAIHQKRTHRCIELNQQFHLSFYEIAEQPLTFRLITGLWLRAGAFMHASLRSDGVIWRTHHHLELIEALKAGDAKACRKAIEADIKDTYGDVAKQPHVFA